MFSAFLLVGILHPNVFSSVVCDGWRGIESISSNVGYLAINKILTPKSGEDALKICHKKYTEQCLNCVWRDLEGAYLKMKDRQCPVTRKKLVLATLEAA